MASNLGLDPIGTCPRAIDWLLTAPCQANEQGPRQHIEHANARWQLEEHLAALQVEDKDARRNLLNVETAGPADAHPGA